jgi:intracellular multiplication protein IcmJ
LSFLPLTLGVTGGDAKSGGAPKPPSRSEAEQIFKRDDFACRFCGFRSVQFQRLVQSREGYVTCCSFCEQALHLDRAGIMGGGILIWLPEITQAELNHIVRAGYVAKAEAGTPMATIATRALDALTARRTEAKKRLGTDDPLLLATVLHENMTPAGRDEAIGKLDGVRLLPLDKHMVRSAQGDVNGFDRMIRFWRSKDGPFAALPNDEWQGLFDKIAA